MANSATPSVELVGAFQHPNDFLDDAFGTYFIQLCFFQLEQ